MSQYTECICTTSNKSRSRPVISFREANISCGSFVGTGPGYEHFGITMYKNETKAHAVERLLGKRIKEINKEIAKLEREKYSYIAIMDKWNTADKEI